MAPVQHFYMALLQTFYMALVQNFYMTLVRDFYMALYTAGHRHMDLKWIHDSGAGPPRVTGS
jgi:hypothetical protein